MFMGLCRPKTLQVQVRVLLTVLSSLVLFLPIKASASDSNSVSAGVVAGIRIMINNQDTRLKNWYMVQAANAAKAEITMENGATSSASGSAKIIFNPGQGDGVVNYPSVGGDGGIAFLRA